MSTCLRIVLAALVLATVSAAQLPEVIYLKFEGPNIVNRALPGVTFTSVEGGEGRVPGPVGNNALNGYTTIKTQFALEGDWTLEFWGGGGYWNYYSGAAFNVMHGGSFEGRGSQPPFLGSQTRISFYDGTSGTTETPFELVIGFSQTAWGYAAFTYEDATRTLTHHTPLSQWTYTAPFDLNLICFGRLALADGSVRLDELRIWDHQRSRQDLLANHDVQLTRLPTDLRPTRLLQPDPAADFLDLGATETVTVEAANYGSQALPMGTPLTWSYSLDGATPVSEVEVLTQDFAPDATRSHSFQAPVDLSGRGTHELRCEVAVGTPPSGQTNERRFELRRGSSVSGGGVPWVETFRANDFREGRYYGEAPLGWEAMERPSPTYPSDYVTQPARVFDDHTDPANPSSGSLVLFNAYYGYGAPAGAWIKSPPIDLRQATNPEVGFWFRTYSMSGGQIELLVDDLTTGVSNIPVTSVPDPAVDGVWTLATADLSLFAGHDVRVFIDATGLTPTLNMEWAASVHMDDFSVFDTAIQGFGQAPRAGLATMEINTSFGAGHARPESGDPGPYFAQTAVGDLLQFRFEGEPSQWLALLWGELNPSVVDYGAIGAADIGTGFDAMTGLPANIWIVADGLNPTRPIDYLFNTDINGRLFLDTVTPALPSGSYGAFQAVFGTANGNYFALSNAVELVVW